MVRIRLFRTGTTKRPMYRIVVIDGRKKRQGRVLQRLGTYDPLGGGGISVDLEGLESWVGRGAQMSDTIRSLLRRHRNAAPAAEAAEASTGEAEAGTAAPAPAGS